MVVTLRKFVFIFFIAAFITVVHGQEVYEPMRNTDLYDFLDELANSGIITLNTACKPYSRIQISRKLFEADILRTKLNARQKKELDFFKKDFDKDRVTDAPANKRFDLIYTRDSILTLSVNPVLGLEYSANQSGTLLKNWYGAEAYSYIGKNLGLYFGLRKNRESKAVSNPEYLNLEDPGLYWPDGHGGGVYSEIRGGITYSWKKGSFGLLRDRFEWGEAGHGSNLVSAHHPAFPYLRLQLRLLRWMELTYVHGWLDSRIIDSTGTQQNGMSGVTLYQPKYFSANVFTLNPGKKFQVMIGNSVVYSDRDVRLGYLVPVVYGLGAGDANGPESRNRNVDSQVFLSMSSRQVNNLHIYLDVFVNGWSASGFRNNANIHQSLSTKLGIRLSNPGQTNTFFTAEVTRNNSLAFQSPNLLTTFASAGYSLGHYLGGNSQEIYVSAGFRPQERILIEVSWTDMQKADIPGATNSPVRSSEPVLIKHPVWSGKDYTLQGHYQVINDAWLFAGVSFTRFPGTPQEVYTNEFYRGRQLTFQVGGNMGF